MDRTKPPETTFVAQRRTLLSDLVELAAHRETMAELVKCDLKVRYKRSVLGQFWSLLNPLLIMMVTTIVFSNFFRFAIENFPIYMLTAHLIWSFFAQGTLAASGSLLTNASLVRRVYLPPALFPLAAVNSAGINCLLSLIPLALLVVFTGGRLTWTLAFVPIALGLTLLFTYGVALTLAAVSVFFHDAIHMYQVLLMAGMYLTPIFYPIEIVPAAWSFAFYSNPLYYFVELFRQPIYANTLPDPLQVGVAAAYAVGSASFGWWYFERSRKAFAGYL